MPYKAYPAAGYKHHEGNAYRLTRNDMVQQRVQEIIDEAFSKDELDQAITPEWIRTKIVELARGAETEPVQLRGLETLAKYQPGMTEEKQQASLKDEANKLVASLGYGMAKAILEENGISHVLDLVDVTPEQNQALSPEKALTDQSALAENQAKNA